MSNFHLQVELLKIAHTDQFDVCEERSVLASKIRYELPYQNQG